MVLGGGLQNDFLRESKIFQRRRAWQERGGGKVEEGGYESEHDAPHLLPAASFLQNK